MNFVGVMIVIKAKNSNEAWRNTFRALMDSGEDTGNDKYYRDEPVIIEITDPAPEKSDPLFPMSQEDLDVINHFITTGENEEQVVHEWTKIYYHRAFDEPNRQIEFMINKLREASPAGEAQVSMWDKNIDQNAEISPCTQILWARVKHGKLEWHTHAHSCDAYNKLLMNIQEFISLQYYVAKRLDIPVGTYYHFIDSCHIRVKNLAEVKQLLKLMSA